MVMTFVAYSHLPNIYLSQIYDLTVATLAPPIIYSRVVTHTHTQKRFCSKYMQVIGCKLSVICDHNVCDGRAHK